MLKSKSFLAIDFGASNLKAAEFEVNEGGGLLLRQYGLKSLGQAGLQEAGREGALLRCLQELLSERGFSAKNVNICVPGFNTFSKFVKLPPVDTSKVTQIIQYEAQQNVPFPLEEVVWDYQILGRATTGELEVLLVAIKIDVVEGIYRVVENAGLRLQLADVSPAALCNAFRYNYGDLDGCTLLLDIGARTSNLIFFENSNVYSRGINIGANTITQDFARESKLSHDEAEQVVIQEGFVSLGGAYEEPENPNQAAISKIARQVMTKLHIQVNQTVQYYRGQQSGSAPDRLFLAGGASVMPYTAQFFAEKLNVEVEYFNPLRNVDLDPSIDREELVKVAHGLGESVGLGLRNLAHCPVELNLMPASSLRRQEINQRKPYFAVAFACLVLVLVAFGWFYDKVAIQKSLALEQLKEKVDPLKRNEAALRKVSGELRAVKAQLDQYIAWMEGRTYWFEMTRDIREVFLQVERRKAEELRTETGVDAKTGVWIERLMPFTEHGPIPIGPLFMPGQVFGGRPAPASPGPRRPAQPAIAVPGISSTGTTNQPPPPPPTNALTRLELYCRGVNLDHVKADANTKLAFAVAEALKTYGNLAEPAETELFGDLLVDPDNRFTFTFQIRVRLKKPYKF